MRSRRSIGSPMFRSISVQPLISGWDIGIHDFTCIWIFQLAGKSIHFVDYIEDRGHKGPHYLDILDKKAKSWGTPFKAHILPHDVEAREWGSGQSRRITLMDATPTPILTADRVSDADGIHAVRGILGISLVRRDAVSARAGAVAGLQEIKIRHAGARQFEPRRRRDEDGCGGASACYGAVLEPFIRRPAAAEDSGLVLVARKLLAWRR